MQGGQATQEGLCGCSCDSWDSLKDVYHDLASAHEDTMPGHARTYQSMSQVVLASTSATSAFTRADCSPGTRLSLPWFPLSIPTLLAKSPSHDGPSASLTFSLPNPTFLFFNYSQWTKKNEMGEKKVFLIFPASSSKHKKIDCFLWDHYLFLIKFS